MTRFYGYKTLLMCTAQFLFVFLLSAISISQTNTNININLQLDYSAAEKCIRLYEDQVISTEEISTLRGNIIAAYTTGLIANRSNVSFLLKSYLDSLKYHQQISDDIYHLEEARKNVSKIKEFFTEITKRNLSKKVVATVEQIFPRSALITTTIPVYVVALGHENADAYVRRIVWQGDEPKFVGNNKGELTIVINLAQSVRYGSDIEQRYVVLLGLVAHEVFHAAFGLYKDNSPQWKQYYTTYNRPIDALLDLTQNEGIAYYLSLDQEWRGYLPPDWSNKTREAFRTFNKNAVELLSPTIEHSRAEELLRTANLSGYWESYGSMTGMFIAREIDLHIGRAALIETIESSPLDFFRKYLKLTEGDNNLPKLAPAIEKEINSN